MVCSKGLPYTDYAVETRSKLSFAAAYRTRVITQDWAGAQVSVKKCAAAFFHFVECLKSGGELRYCAKHTNLPIGLKQRTYESLSCSTKAYDKYLTELQQYELVMTQLDSVAARCDAEVKHYQDVHSEIDASITQTTAEIDALKDQLTTERLIRQQRQEYESFASTVNKLRSKAELQSLVDGVTADIESTELEQKALDAQLDRKRRQVHVVLSTINDMRQSLQEEAAEASKAEDGVLSGLALREVEEGRPSGSDREGGVPTGSDVSSFQDDMVADEDNNINANPSYAEHTEQSEA
jgi:hypothetical protein